MLRYCPNCGTEVDETVIFCPTCGQAIDQATETEMPPAPAWPEPEPGPAPIPPAPPRPDFVDDLPPAPPPLQPPPPPPLPPPPAPLVTDAPRRERLAPDASYSERVARPEPPEPYETDAGYETYDMPDRARRLPAAPPVAAGAELPLTMPATLSGWLIGGGALAGALGALIGLFDGFVNPVEIVLLVVLLGIAATVFLSGSVPHIPHLRLVTLGALLVGFGVALDRLWLGGAGIAELLMFMGTGAAATGAILVELGRDQPVGGASSDT